MIHAFRSQGWAGWTQPKSIAIEGPMRAGKSSLAALLAHHWGAQRIAEREDNPFLPYFYRGEAGAAFAAQMWFLEERRRMLSVRPIPLGSTPCVADFLLAKDKIYASLNLNDAEMAAYNRRYAQVTQDVPQPDLVIYLQASPRTLQARIRSKGIRAERRIAGDYLEQVVQAYEHFFFHYTASPLLVVNTDALDFVRNSGDLHLLLRRLREPVRGTEYFFPVGAQAASA
jgi:deoxyguanosine kinase